VCIVVTHLAHAERFAPGLKHRQRAVQNALVETERTHAERSSSLGAGGKTWQGRQHEVRVQVEVGALVVGINLAVLRSWV